MKCPKCKKLVSITKPLKPQEDAIVCLYCNHTIASEFITWKDGKFRFNVLGEVTAKHCCIPPRLLMKEQQTSVLDLVKLKETAIRIIRREPNLHCICTEFCIADEDIRIEVVLETT